MSKAPRSDTGPFALVPEWVLDLPISNRAVRLYAVLARYADTESLAWPRRELLAERLRCSLSSVDRALDELVDRDALERDVRYRDDGGQSSNLYLVMRAPPSSRLISGLFPELQPPLVTGEYQNESHLEREPLKGNSAASDAPEASLVQGLVGRYVELYRATRQEHDPPPNWRAACGKAVKSALARGEPEDVIRGCLKVIADEGKNPSTLDYVLADSYADRPRRNDALRR